MKIKLGDKIYSVKDGPLMIILTDQDKKNIGEMDPDCTKYCEYDTEKHKPEEIKDWMDRVPLKVLITGSRGFVGKKIIADWEGVDVVGFDQADGEDIFNAEQLEAKLEGCDAVIHLAAYPHRGSTDVPEEFFHLNTDGTKAVAKAALKAGVRRFVYMSTGNIYCFGDGIDDQDSKKPPIDEYGYPDPKKMHPYPASKVASEMYLEKMQTKNATRFDNVIILRPNHFHPTPPEIMSLWHGATIRMDRLVRYTRSACTAPIADRFVIFDVVEPNPNYPSSLEAQRILG